MTQQIPHQACTSLVEKELELRHHLVSFAGQLLAIAAQLTALSSEAHLCDRGHPGLKSIDTCSGS